MRPIPLPWLQRATTLLVLMVAVVGPALYRRYQRTQRARNHWARIFQARVDAKRELEQIFVEKKVYKRLETADTQSKVHSTIATGMKKYQKLFVRPISSPPCAAPRR